MGNPLLIFSMLKTRLESWESLNSCKKNMVYPREKEIKPDFNRSRHNLKRTLNLMLLGNIKIGYEDVPIITLYCTMTSVKSS